jgi:hypothetical protein
VYLAATLLNLTFTLTVCTPSSLALHTGYRIHTAHAIWRAVMVPYQGGDGATMPFMSHVTRDDPATIVSSVSFSSPSCFLHDHLPVSIIDHRRNRSPAS